MPPSLIRLHVPPEHGEGFLTLKCEPGTSVEVFKRTVISKIQRKRQSVIDSTLVSQHYFEFAGKNGSARLPSTGLMHDICDFSKGIWHKHTTFSWHPLSWSGEKKK